MEYCTVYFDQAHFLALFVNCIVFITWIMCSHLIFFIVIMADGSSRQFNGDAVLFSM